MVQLMCEKIMKLTKLFINKKIEITESFVRNNKISNELTKVYQRRGIIATSKIVLRYFVILF